MPHPHGNNRMRVLTKSSVSLNMDTMPAPNVFTDETDLTDDEFTDFEDDESRYSFPESDIRIEAEDTDD